MSSLVIGASLRVYLILQYLHLDFKSLFFPQNNFPILVANIFAYPQYKYPKTH